MVINIALAPNRTHQNFAIDIAALAATQVEFVGLLQR